MAEKGVVIRPSFCEAMRALKKKDQLALFWAICDYGIYGTEPEGLSALAAAFFTLIQPNLESASTRYQSCVSNGASGGAPKGNKNAKKKQPENNQAKQPQENEKQPDCNEKQPENNPAKQPPCNEKQPRNNLNIDIDKDIDIDRDIDIDIEKDIACAAAHPAQTVAGKPRTNKKFTIPSVRDVEGYCRENGYAVDAERFVDYYSAVGWKVGKNPMRDWQAAVRTWVRKDSPAPAAPQDDHCGYVLAPLEDPWEVAMRGKYHV